MDFYEPLAITTGRTWSRPCPTSRAGRRAAPVHSSLWELFDAVKGNKDPTPGKPSLRRRPAQQVLRTLQPLCPHPALALSSTNFLKHPRQNHRRLQEGPQFFQNLRAAVSSAIRK